MPLSESFSFREPLGSLFPASARVAVSEGSDDPPPLMPPEVEAIQHAVASRRREFALGRWCARRALDMLGVPPEPILIGPRHVPQWPPGVVGSITHCRGFVGAVVARADQLRAIGFDAELAEHLDPDLIPLICTAAEIEWLGVVGEGSGVDWAKVVFSAKEAIHKCICPVFGLTLDFLNVTLTIDRDRRTFTARASAPGSTAGVDVSPIVGRLAVTDSFVFTTAVVDSPAWPAPPPATPISRHSG